MKPPLVSAVPAEYSDVTQVTGSSISPDECLWLNEVKGTGIAASKFFRLCSDKSGEDTIGKC